MLEGPNTSSSQPISTIPETRDSYRDDEVIVPREGQTAASRPFIRLCDPAAITLPLHSTPLDEFSSTHETPARLETQRIFTVSPVVANLPSPVIPHSRRNLYNYSRLDHYTCVFYTYICSFITAENIKNL